MTIFPYICTFFYHKMKVYRLIIVTFILCLYGCGGQKEDNSITKKEIFHKVFYHATTQTYEWDRIFDTVAADVDITKETTFDLSLRISFTDDYQYNDLPLVFSVLDEYENPYRTRPYKLTVKDKEGHWNVEKSDGCYTYTLPLNKELKIIDPGKYRFLLEQRMPITPLMGVKEVTLVNEAK